MNLVNLTWFLPGVLLYNIYAPYLGLPSNHLQMSARPLSKITFLTILIPLVSKTERCGQLLDPTFGITLGERSTVYQQDPG